MPRSKKVTIMLIYSRKWHFAVNEYPATNTRHITANLTRNNENKTWTITWKWYGQDNEETTDEIIFQRFTTARKAVKLTIPKMTDIIEQHGNTDTADERIKILLNCVWTSQHARSDNAAKN